MNVYKRNSQVAVLLGDFIVKLCIVGSLCLFIGGLYLACEEYHNDTIFIQIWVKRSEVNELKSCKPGTHVRVERPNDEYYILPCRAVKEIR